MSLHPGQRLVQLDPAFSRVVRREGAPPRHRPVRVDDRFATLLRSITSQLLATAAARTIHGRVLEVIGPRVTPEAVLATSVDELRTAGLSHAKVRAMHALAEQVAAGQINVARHGRMSDEAVTAELCGVPGIGPWTAQMYLLFTLGRHDVWPVKDFGVRHGWAVIHGLDELPSERYLRDAGDALRGVRSAVAWYCWRAADNPPTD